MAQRVWFRPFGASERPGARPFLLFGASERPSARAVPPFGASERPGARAIGSWGGSDSRDACCVPPFGASDLDQLSSFTGRCGGGCAFLRGLRAIAIDSGRAKSAS